MFCRCKHNLREWRYELYTILYYALLSDSSARAGVEINYLQTSQLLQKLIETAHLVKVRETGEACDNKL
jgi:hypothetical protein